MELHSRKSFVKEVLDTNLSLLNFLRVIFKHFLVLSDKLAKKTEILNTLVSADCGVIGWHIFHQHSDYKEERSLSTLLIDLFTDKLDAFFDTVAHK